jgi:hypothetical protein
MGQPILPFLPRRNPGHGRPLRTSLGSAGRPDTVRRPPFPEHTHPLADLRLFLSSRLPEHRQEDLLSRLAEDPPESVAWEIHHWARRPSATGSLAARLSLGLRRLRDLSSFREPISEAHTRFLRQVSEAVISQAPGETRDASGLRLAAAPPSWLGRTNPESRTAMGPSRDGLSLVLDRLDASRTEGSDGWERGKEVREAVLSSALDGVALEATLDDVRRRGLASGTREIFDFLAEAVPRWPPPHPEAENAPAVNAMERLVRQAPDDERTARRFDELMEAGIAAFNQGVFGRAGAVFTLAERLLDRGVVEAGRVASLMSGHERLDPERLRRLLDGRDHGELLRALLGLFRVFDPEAVLDQLGQEPERQRRGLLLALLEAHGARGRQAASNRLRRRPQDPLDVFLLRNLVHLLRRIPRDGQRCSLKHELASVVRLLVAENPPLLVREVLAYFAETRHPVAEQVLTLFLSTLEDALLSPPVGSGEADRDQWRRHLDETAVALARHGTPCARAALLEHGLRTDPELSGAGERLAALGRCDLSALPDLVGRLLQAGRAELPPGFFAQPTPQQARRLLNLVTALAGSSRADGVRELLELLAACFSEHDFGRRAAETLRAPVGGPLSGPVDPRAGLFGSLTVFGLPTLVQSLADLQVSGELTLLDQEGRRAATLELERGRLCRAQHGALGGSEAVYQLLERPVHGTFAFVDRSHEEEDDQSLPPVTMLLLEGLRRQDELRRAIALVPDDARLVPTGRPPRAVPGEDDIDLLTTLWEKIVAGVAPSDCEGLLAVDAYRVRRCLACWVEEGALHPGGLPMSVGM